MSRDASALTRGIEPGAAGDCGRRLDCMRIAVDARAATEVAAGRGRVVRELLRSLARLDHDHEFALLAREQWNCEELDDRFRWRLLGWTDPFWALRAAPAAGDADVLLATNSYLLAAAARTEVRDVEAIRKQLPGPQLPRVCLVTADDDHPRPLVRRRAHLTSVTRTLAAGKRRERNVSS